MHLLSCASQLKTSEVAISSYWVLDFFQDSKIYMFWGAKSLEDKILPCLASLLSCIEDWDLHLPPGLCAYSKDGIQLNEKFPLNFAGDNPYPVVSNRDLDIETLGRCLSPNFAL
mgnify:CR=1 FL=1